MHVLFLGPKFGNSYLEYKALKRICKKVDIIDTNLIFKNTLSLKIFYHVAPELFIWKIRNFIFNSYINVVNYFYVDLYKITIFLISLLKKLISFKKIFFIFK